MEIITFDQELVIESQYNNEQQLENYYYMPQIVDQQIQQTWQIKYLQHIDDQHFFVRFKYQKLKVRCEFILQKGDKKYILQVVETKDSYPVFGSILLFPFEIFTITFQKFKNNQFYYAVYVFYPQIYERIQSLQDENDNIMQIIPPQLEKVQVHLLFGLKQNKKEIKKGKQVLYDKYQCYTRTLMMIDNLVATEQCIYFDEYRHQIQRNETSTDQIICEYINKQFKQKMVKVQNFCIFNSNIKQIQQIFNNCEQNLNVVYQTYNEQHNQFVYVQKNLLNTKVSFIINIYNFTEQSEKKPVFKLFYQQNTPIVKIGNNVIINGFDGQLIDSQTCNCQYLVLSAMNQVVTFTYTFRNQLILEVFHIQTGSAVKICSESYLDNMNVQNINCDSSKFNCEALNQAQRMCQFLIKLNFITPEQQQQYQQYYYSLLLRQMIVQQQPRLVIQNFSLCWQVPNYKKNKQQLYIIKILPYIPIEVLMSQHTMLYKQHNYWKLLDFLNLDKEFQKTEQKQLNLVDQHINSKIYEQFYFKISSNVLKQNLQNQQITICYPIDSEDFDNTSSDQAHQFVNTTKNNKKSTNSDFLLSPQFSNYKGDDSQDTTCATQNVNQISQLSRLQNLSFNKGSSSILNEQSNVQISLFSDIVNTPLFTNQEVSFVLNQLHNIAKHKNYYCYQNYLLWQDPLQSLYKKNNNMLTQIDLQQSFNQVAYQYESKCKNDCDLTQFAALSLIFGCQVFDCITQSSYNIIIHPQRVLQQLSKLFSENIQAQYRLANYLRYLSDLLQQIFQLHRIQTCDFIALVKIIFGTDFGKFINNFIKEEIQQAVNPQQTTLIVEQICSFLISNVLKLEIQQTIQPLLFVSIIKLSCALQNIILHIESRQQIISSLSVDYIFADYLYFGQFFNKYQTNRELVFTLADNPQFYDFKNNHILSKMFTYTIFMQQQLLVKFFNTENTLVKYIKLQNMEEINKMQTSYQNLQYYKLFNKPINILNTFQKQSLTKNHDTKFLNTDIVTGDDMLLQIYQHYQSIQNNIQKLVLQENIYTTLIMQTNDTKLSNDKYYLQHLQLIQQLIEDIVIFQQTQQENNLQVSNQPITSPFWLNTMIQDEFFKCGLDMQFNIKFHQNNNCKCTQLSINQSNKLNIGEYKLYSQQQLQPCYQNQFFPQQKQLSEQFKYSDHKIMSTFANSPLNQIYFQDYNQSQGKSENQFRKVLLEQYFKKLPHILIKMNELNQCTLTLALSCQEIELLLRMSNLVEVQVCDDNSMMDEIYSKCYSFDLHTECKQDDTLDKQCICSKRQKIQFINQQFNINNKTINYKQLYPLLTNRNFKDYITSLDVFKQFMNYAQIKSNQTHFSSKQELLTILDEIM